MDEVTKEDIKYQFLNVFEDLLSDLKNAKNVRPETENDNDDDVITLAPEIKKPAPAPVYKTRGRPRKNDSVDSFLELKATRAKRKQPSGRQTDIRASFNSSFNSVNNEGPIHVVADVHRDSSQPIEASAHFKKKSATSDEIFDSLLDKKSKETEISCSQESDDYFQVSKKPRKSYPGAKSSTAMSTKRTSRGSVRKSTESVHLDSELDFKEFKGQLKKNLGSLTSKFSKSPNSKEDSPETDKLRSSPGWSRVKAVAKDFKGSSYKKPLNISINKPRLSSSKSSSFVAGASKAANSSLNQSTSDSDLSDLRYFDSPEAAKRYKLMKHVVDLTEKKDQNNDSGVEIDPSMKELAENLAKNRDAYVQNLISCVNNKMSRRSATKSTDCTKKASPVKDSEKIINEDDKTPSKPKVQNNEAQKSKSPENIIDASDPMEFDNQETQFDFQPTTEKIYDGAENNIAKSPLSTKKHIESPLRRNQSKENGSPINSEKPLVSSQEEIFSDDSKSPSSPGKLFDPSQNEGKKKEVQSPSSPEKAVQPEDKRRPRTPLKSGAFKYRSPSKPCSENSVVCIGEFECTSQSAEDVASNEKRNPTRELRDVSKKDDVLELSNCDVSEARIPRDEQRKSNELARKKLNTKSQDLDDLLTQILPQSSGSSASNEVHYEATIPLVSSQNLCSRCKCTVTNLAGKEDNSVNSNPKLFDSENQENSPTEPKKILKDACVQTEDVTIVHSRTTKESGVQTVPLSQSLETVPCKDMTEEKLMRLKDEYILQTMKSLMIQASHKLTLNDLYNLGLEQENERPRKKLREITQNSSRLEEDANRLESLLLQPRSFSANRITNDNSMHPPTDQRTPQNQVIKRKTASDMKYTAVSTPSSSERKLLDDSKFINRSTVCPKDVTICETEEAHPADDSMMKDVVPMEVEEDLPTIVKSAETRENMPPKPEEIDTSRLDIVRIRDKMNSSCSNDSLVLSSRKAAHRSLNFQSFFARASDSTPSSPPKAVNSDGKTESYFSSECNGIRTEDEGDSKKRSPMDLKSDNSNSILHDQQVNTQFPEDTMKHSSNFSNPMDTQKPDEGNETGIVENSDDESIIQATPKKFGAESSLTPDMLSSQNSQVTKQNDGDLHPAFEAENSDSHRPAETNAAARNCPPDSDNSVTKHTNSIDSQVNEIPSSILPTAEDCYPKQTERRNSFFNPQLPHQVQNVERLSREFIMNHNPQPVHPPVHNYDEGKSHTSELALSQDLVEQRRLFITTSGLQKSALMGVQEFCKRFNCVYESEITERTTHLVVRTNQNRALSTMKFILAVAMHKLVVTLDWMSSCMKAGELIPESPFIPLSSSGRAGPLNSLLDKTNAVSSPLFRQFIVHIVGPFVMFKKENLMDLLLFSGAKIAESYPDLAADRSRIRLVLINSKSAEEKCSFYCDVMQRYKAFVLLHDWAIESVSNYKVEPFSNHNPLPVVYSFEMINNFLIPGYIKDQALRYFESHDDSFDETSELSSQA
nr:PREDICTED: uncharacterized protein LOC109043237 [Bemisia tabaci]